MAYPVPPGWPYLRPQQCVRLPPRALGGASCWLVGTLVLAIACALMGPRVWLRLEQSPQTNLWWEGAIGPLTASNLPNVCAQRPLDPLLLLQGPAQGH